MTLTILAADPRTGEMGVTSFTFGLAVGAGIVHHSRDHGLVAVQAFGDPAWAAGLLASLGSHTWPEAVAGLAREPGFDAAQLAGLSTGGDVFAFTGSNTEAFAGETCEHGICCVANLMAVDGLTARVTGYFRSLDPLTSLAYRLVQSARHADALGGDVRGRMSAFVKTFHSDPGYRPVDLRVDYHPDAVVRLAHLERIHRAHELLDSALDRRIGYADVAVTGAAYKLAPDSAATASAHLLARLRTEDPTDPRLRSFAGELIRQRPGLLVHLRRLESAGRLPAGTINRLDIPATPTGWMT